LWDRHAPEILRATIITAWSRVYDVALRGHLLIRDTVVTEEKNCTTLLAPVEWPRLHKRSHRVALSKALAGRAAATYRRRAGEAGQLVRTRVCMVRVGFVLVHGTFARGAEWTQPNSALQTALHDTARSQGSDAEVRTLTWTGRNRSRDRIKAAEQLGKVVSDLHHSGVRQVFLIGHSHGGSAIAHYIKNSMQNPPIAGAAFLSTPFIALRRRSDSKELATSLLISLLILISPLLCGFVFIAFGLLWENLGFGDAPILVPLILAILPLAALIYLGASRRGIYDSILSRTSKHISLHETARLPDGNYLFLRSSGDEAAMALSFVQFIALATNFLIGKYMRLMAHLWIAFTVIRRSLLLKTVMLFLLVYYALWLAGTLEAGTYSHWRYAWTGAFDTGIMYQTGLKAVDAPFNLVLRILWIPFFVMSVVAALASALFLVALSLNSIVLWSFGWLGFLDSLFLEVSIEPVPYGSYTLHHLDWSQNRAGALNHSLTYRNALALDALQDWILRSLSNSPAVSTWAYYE
jgi:hypothetical protein